MFFNVVVQSIITIY
jgi:hypothetical protein